MHVPFFNYGVRFAADRQDILRIVAEVGASDNFILKDRVAVFEQLLRDYTGARYVVAVANGTMALTLSLAALGIGPGDDVLTPAFSFISSASSIAHLGARPVFVDVDPETCTILPAEIERHITPRTRAILPVHLFASLATMTEISSIARKHELAVVEDSAVALGARLHETSAGLLGDIGVYSFFPAKPLGGIGDGGAIVTNDEHLWRSCRMLRNHGQDGVNRFLHHLIGYNSRMDEVMGGYLSHRIKMLPLLLQRRAELASIYNTKLRSLAPSVLIPPASSCKDVYYTYVIKCTKRDVLRAYLAQHNIETQIYYPRPLHLQPAFAYLGYQKGNFPNAEHISERMLALPLYPEMSEEQIAYVSEIVVKFYAQTR